MRSLALSVFCLSGLCAQTPAPQSHAPALPDLPDTASVASCEDGHVVTMGEMRGLLLAIDNPQASANLREFLNQWCMTRKLARLAQDEKLDKESPTREQLMWTQNFVLAQAEITHVANPVIPGDEAMAYYEQHKSQYEQVKTYAIYIAFSSAAASQMATDGKKVLSEIEAKAKIASLREQIRKGADFKKLAKENSDDEQSQKKDGFFGDLKPSDAMPDSIRNAIFNLKPGDTTEVIAQPNGFYIFRAEEILYKSYSEVRDQVDRTLKQERADKWMRTTQSETKATILTDKIK